MASNVTAHSLLDKISEGHLECSICTNRFRQPKVLDCLHSFCLKCLQELTQCQGTSGTKLTCPLCRRETILEMSGVADLPNNFTLSALVEEVTMQEKLLEGQGSEIKCQNCDEENQAVSKCMDCDHFLCQECQKAHARMTVMKSHKIYTLAQLQSGEIVYKSKLREEVPKCGKHPDQNLNVYCSTCEQVICLMCTVLDHGNPKHSLIGLPEALEKCKKTVAELVAKVEKSKAELDKTLHETDMSHKKLDTLFANTKKKISRKADEEVAKIREEEQKLLKETERIYKDRVTTFENAHTINSKEVTQAEHKLDEVKQLMAQARCHEILELQQKLWHNLRELTEKQPEKVPDTLAFLDFEEGQGSLGRLVLQEAPKTATKQSPLPWGPSLKKVWQLKTVANSDSTQKIITQVAAFSNSEIHVFALVPLQFPFLYSKQLLCTVVLLSKSRHAPPPILQRLQIKGLTNVRCIAVSKDDNLIAVDVDTVKVFNKELQLIHQFTPGNKGLNNQPTCLAVDDNNLIAVGYEGMNQIFLHKPDGSLVRRLPAPMIDRYLTVYKEHLIYTTKRSGQMLCAVDYHGAMVFSVDIAKDMQTGNPAGVCCDSDGSIYVAMNFFLGGKIFHYSPDGKYIGHVISDCGAAYDITFTSDGDLVVATGNSVKIYHRV